MKVIIKKLVNHNQTPKEKIVLNLESIIENLTLEEPSLSSEFESNKIVKEISDCLEKGTHNNEIQEDIFLGSMTNEDAKITTNEIMTMQVCKGGFTNYPLHAFKIIEIVNIKNITDVKKYQKERMHLYHRQKGTFDIMSYIEADRLHFIVPVHPMRAIINYMRFQYFNYVTFKPRAARIRKIKACIVPVFVTLVLIGLVYFGNLFMNGAFNPFD